MEAVAHVRVTGFDKISDAEARDMAVWRHDIHRHPETAFEEHRTAGKIAELLRSFGLEVETGIGKTGVVGS